MAQLCPVHVTGVPTPELRISRITASSPYRGANHNAKFCNGTGLPFVNADGNPLTDDGAGELM